MDSEAAPISSSSPPVYLELCDPSEISQPKTQHFRFNHVRLGKRSIVTQMQVLLVVSTRLHSLQSKDFREEQQQDSKWCGLSSDGCWSTSFPFEGPWGLCPLCGLWLLTRHMLNSVLNLGGAGGKIWTGRSCELVEAGDGGVLHFFIILTRRITLRLVTIQIHYYFTYLIRRQQTGPFSTRSLTTFHFTADRKTPPSVLQQTFNSLQTIICRLAWRKCFFPLPSKNRLACYKNPSGFMTQTFHSLCKIRE